MKSRRGLFDSPVSAPMNEPDSSVSSPDAQPTPNRGRTTQNCGVVARHIFRAFASSAVTRTRIVIRTQRNRGHMTDGDVAVFHQRLADFQSLRRLKADRDPGAGRPPGIDHQGQTDERRCNRHQPHQRRHPASSPRCAALRAYRSTDARGSSAIASLPIPYEARIETQSGNHGRHHHAAKEDDPRTRFGGSQGLELQKRRCQGDDGHIEHRPVADEFNHSVELAPLAPARQSSPPHRPEHEAQRNEFGRRHGDTRDENQRGDIPGSGPPKTDRPR